MEGLENRHDASGKQNGLTPEAAASLPQSGDSHVQARALIYDLRLGDPDSDAFFETASEFSDRLLAEIDLRAGPLIDGYTAYVRDELREADRSRGEYGLDLMVMGLALGRYLGAAEVTSGWVVGLANELDWLRREAPWTRRLADKMRAVLHRFYLAPRIGRKANEEPYSLRRLWLVIDWLQSTGEFEQEIRRLNNWRSYLDTLSAAKADDAMKISVALLDWFEPEAANVLGRYTEGVKPFLSGEYARRRRREDQIFCGRAPLEYHLAMAAAEIMNRGMRERFNQTRKRVVLLPVCMRSQSAESCKARDVGGDMVCSGCDPACSVNRITVQMHSLGVSVYMIPHSTGFSRWLARWQREADTGVVAVACLMNILPGGYEMHARRIASQCVPLDFPGYQKHWNQQQLATGLNEERLVRIVTATVREPVRTAR